MTRAKLLSSVALLALTIGSAHGQGLGAPRVPVAMTSGVANWTGAYAGALLGAGIGQNRWTDIGGIYNPPNTSFTSSPVGVALGLFAGYNWQTSANLVFGIEADITYNTASGSAHVSGGYAFVNSKSQFAGSLRGRAGVAVDKALFYVTGGLAFGNPSQSYVDNGFVVARSDSFRLGYVVGLGSEYMVSQNWTVRLEALYYDFGTNRPRDLTNNGYSFASRSSQIQVRAGAAYRF
ncbi:porin family protein [Phreatobacter aquaticus]|uniref:Porin family protein n=1 Tax=Phreatobacter aquaticus TaxID=2570229 RepID=A0A4D7QMI0_9HYPH|nr:outer membrane beta-barrel protein [Phreatobacter aquaticus]QCK86676.1 porin family protein [Phreatobacter aquaticus]